MNIIDQYFGILNELVANHNQSYESAQKIMSLNFDEVEKCISIGQDSEMIANWLVILTEG